eukprot:TRINITY_DN15856_c0_g1_i3.p1 TRINITY_DN15856_c0_g1~~TRINITY_DN15856_c0_g1_i3.p1  ORF type:complete len:354 (+),score=92.12 TRINITY_DN15856_c0_g1_i3:103-1164(+)
MAAAAAEPAAGLPEVGAVLRVRTPDGLARRCTVCCTDPASGSADVILHAPPHDDGAAAPPPLEEARVSLSELSPLLPFEREEPSAQESVPELRARAGELFRAGDAAAALELYDRAAALLRGSPEVGCSVLLRGAGAAEVWFPGTVASVDSDGRCDVLTDADDCPDEDAVPPKRLVVLGTDPGCAAALQLNQARCALRLRLWRRAARHARSALVRARFAEGPDGERLLGAEAVSVASFLLARALEGAGEHKRALAAARDAVQADASNREAKALVAKLERQQVERQRSNRQLAREVAKWLDSAVGRRREGGDAPPAQALAAPPAQERRKSPLCSPLLRRAEPQRRPHAPCPQSSS